MKKYPALRALLKKKNRAIIFTTRIFLLLSVICFVVIGIIENKEMPEAEQLNLAIINDEIGAWSYVDVSLMSDHFATYEVNGSVQDYYYFVWDSSDYLYIALLNTDAIYEELADVYQYSFKDSAASPDPVRIFGTTEEIPNDLKSIAIDYLNELYGENLITEDNFEEYCGGILLNQKVTPKTISDVPILFFLVFVSCAFVFGVVTFFYYLETRKALKRLDEVDKERIESDIANQRGLHIEGTGLFLTDQFVVNVANSLRVYRYEEILWIYLYRLKRYGVTSSISIKIGDDHGKVRTIATSSPKYAQDLEELMREIARRCPNVLVGYTSENKKAYKQMR